MGYDSFGRRILREEQLNTGADYATTVWETWEGYSRSGKAKMSHNHYALGSVARFLTEGVVGIRPLTPGFRTMAVRPLVGGGLTSAGGGVQTPFGRAESAWQVVGDDVEFTITVPPGTTAEFQPVGSDETSTLQAGTHVLRRRAARR